MANVAANLLTNISDAAGALQEAQPTLTKAIAQYNAASPDIDWFLENKYTIVAGLAFVVFVSAYFGALTGVKAGK